MSLDGFNLPPFWQSTDQTCTDVAALESASRWACCDSSESSCWMWDASSSRSANGCGNFSMLGTDLPALKELVGDRRYGRATLANCVRSSATLDHLRSLHRS